MAHKHAGFGHSDDAGYRLRQSQILGGISRLPPDGDLERGKAAFLELKCYTVRVPVEASRNFEWVANAGLPREVQFGLRFEV